jgi:hypothetical protein
VHPLPAHAGRGLAWDDGERGPRPRPARSGHARRRRRADFVAWNVEHPNELSYWFGHNPCARVVAGGKERRAE